MLFEIIKCIRSIKIRSSNNVVLTQESCYNYSKPLLVSKLGNWRSAISSLNARFVHNRKHLPNSNFCGSRALEMRCIFLEFLHSHIYWFFLLLRGCNNVNPCNICRLCSREFLPLLKYPMSTTPGEMVMKRTPFVAYSALNLATAMFRAILLMQ